jgi:hypothetical protein
VSEPKTQCSKCGVDILLTTADRTGGLCMPCKSGGPRRPDPNATVEVSCSVHSDVSPTPLFFTSAQDLLEELEKARHIGGPTHANKFELEAQRALARHAIQYRVNLRFNDDHWGRTGYALLTLFEQGKATMQLDNRRFRFSEVSKENWIEGTAPLASYGGFLYRDSEGVVIFKTQTWIS